MRKITSGTTASRIEWTLAELAKQCVWFEVEPLPGDFFLISVKPEADQKLRDAIKNSPEIITNPVRPDDEAFKNAPVRWKAPNASGVVAMLYDSNVSAIVDAIGEARESMEAYLDEGIHNVDYGDEWPEVAATKAERLRSWNKALRLLTGEPDNAIEAVASAYDAHTAASAGNCTDCGEQRVDGGDGGTVLCPKCDEKEEGDDLCDRCMSAGVVVSHTDENGTVCTNCAAREEERCSN